jgi:hypothetical protein
MTYTTAEHCKIRGRLAMHVADGQHGELLRREKHCDVGVAEERGEMQRGVAL